MSVTSSFAPHLTQKPSTGGTVCPREPLPARIEVNDHEAIDALLRLKHLGGSPKTVIDIGAAVGEWSCVCARIFPDANYYLVDANPKAALFLKDACTHWIPKAKFDISYLGDHHNSFTEFEDMGFGSSSFPEATPFPRQEIAVKTKRLDAVLFLIEQPLFLKIDVQGAELKVLQGGTKILKQAAAVFLELSLLPYNEGAPLLHEVVAFMAEQGFLMWDLCPASFIRADGVPFQLNAVFVPENSPLREPRPFWPLSEDAVVDTDYCTVRPGPDLDKCIAAREALCP